MRREWKTEWMKVRYRKIWLVLLGFLVMTFPPFTTHPVQRKVVNI